MNEQIWGAVIMGLIAILALYVLARLWSPNRQPTPPGAIDKLPEQHWLDGSETALGVTSESHAAAMARHALKSSDLSITLDSAGYITGVKIPATAEEPKTAPKPEYRYRSAITGKFVKASYAKRYPHRTVRSKVKS